MKKIYTLLIIVLFASFSLFAEQVVSNDIDDFEDTITITPSTQSTTVVANASPLLFSALLNYMETPLEEGAKISTTADNQDLLLNQSWELFPFSIAVTGSGTSSFNLYINLEVGFFQLLDSEGKVAQGNEGYTITSQAMKIEDTTIADDITFENIGTNSNQYKYTIPLNPGNFYSNSDMANFKLTWIAKTIPQPGNYRSEIQIQFSVD